MIIRLKDGGFQEKFDRDKIEKSSIEMSESMLKKVNFYRNKAQNSNYMIPPELKDLVVIQDDTELKQMIDGICREKIDKDIQEIEEMREQLKDRTVPDFLLDEDYFKIKGGRKFGSNMQFMDKGIQNVH
jgi:uncharacterized protein YjaG (DUF416 family)